MSEFYGIYLADPWCSTMIDLMRFVCDPAISERCHITLRGPYQEKRDQRHRWNQHGFQWVRLVGVGNFLQQNQNTIFLHIKLPNQSIVWKPHYPNSPAHVTLYDGPDTELARQLFEKMSEVLAFQADLRTTKLLHLQDNLLPFEDDLLLKSELTRLGTNVEEIKSDKIGIGRRLRLATSAAYDFKALLENHRRITNNYLESPQMLFE